MPYTTSLSTMNFLKAVSILFVATSPFSLVVTEASSFGGLIPVHRIGEMEGSIGFYQAIEMLENSLLYTKQSEYQKIEVHQSRFYGKVLVLDDVIQLTERDADSYNEMMAHIPMFQHPHPKRVLIIGGGDGYVLKEVSHVVG
jgi:spermidine synthase